MKKNMFLLAVTIFLSLMCSGCSKDMQEPISRSDILFDTVINIQIFDSNDTTILDTCFDMCKDYENRFSRTIETSEISQINHSNGKPITISSDTAALISRGLYYSELSNGKFDITVAPLSELWDFKNNTGILPDSTAIQASLPDVNYKNIQLDGTTITITDPNTRLDLGGIAKGFIADQLKAYLESQGVKHALINLGGNVLAVGNKPDGDPFNIGIQKPFDEKNEPITNVEINGQSVVSSGIYERYFKVDDQIYHHILDPKTGYPYQNDLLGVTIISEQSADGDGLSTTCFALGLDEGLKLINSLKNTEAIFITDDYQLHYSNGLKK